jgi:lysophospholipase L1-like esterase
MKTFRLNRIRTAAAVLLTAAILTGGIFAGKTLGVFSMGNYGVPQTPPVKGTALEGKTVLFLGSSVTYGYAAFGHSFADDLREIYGVNAVKEAVSGTTLADLKDNSYVSRLKKLDTELRPDAVLCQLSTNDATKGVPLGEIAAGFEKDKFDTASVAGAIEYIIAYVKDTWGCPIVFYTQARYGSDAYADMTALLQKIGEKWEIGVIDLWNDDAFNEITEEERRRWLADAIHPTKAGYREWWLPKIARELEAVFETA